MTDLYLIAHIVRSEPAFDIATQIEAGDEVMWIVPTSGHRAYPYWTMPLRDVHLKDDHGTYTLLGWGVVPGFGPSDPPPDWPDHYSTSAAKGRGLITNLAAALGFKREEVKRRV